MNIKFSTLTLLLTAIALLNGCTAKLTEPEITFEPPVYVEQMPAKEDKKDFTSTGSIFGQGDNPLFSDHKAMNVSDIVTVVISEAAQSTNTGTKQLAKSDTANLNAGLLSGGDQANGMVASAVKGINGYTDIGFNSGSDSTFTGSGSSTKDASFTTTISARIVKVLKNGNYFISGKREMLIDDQKQIIQLSGVIRPYDIDQNNNINSAQMSDAKILYKSEGDIDRAIKQGWGTKILKAIWPF
ncbi:flagellar basal body L-ring protein FlgH [Sulfurimonas sp.]|uniref:flagellar basal body L-ring protein FlgH n=1 Tax=Sulfurimonas sp. TaxID=2022749 RepID=UPI0025EDE661|nr:flagellar basal body L-ring protein FlgH [Sulfurimonas sp.]MBT5934483.1 flagellar basal body L-ring protein FlgH [Sulfurimonas sp.]